MDREHFVPPGDKLDNLLEQVLAHFAHAEGFKKYRLPRLLNLDVARCSNGHSTLIIRLMNNFVMRILLGEPR